MSLGMMVMRFAWIAQRFVSSKKPTIYASTASCNASRALVCILKLSPNISFMTWWTSLWNGAFLIKSSVDFWYLRISLSAASPGLSLKGIIKFSCSPFYITDCSEWVASDVNKTANISLNLFGWRGFWRFLVCGPRLFRGADNGPRLAVIFVGGDFFLAIRILMKLNWL